MINIYLFSSKNRINYFTITALIICLAFFTSCSKEDIPYRTHIVLIDTNEPEVYTWSDWDRPNMGWETVDNATGNYSFMISGDKIMLTSQKPMEDVSFLSGTMDTEGEPLKITSKN